ncbi:DUF2975 domain-containing protein [Pantoea sp. Tr-811]|uniref:DUF2975 domain-containing protein n=1 Tax=unclassified Pantoea TaxID=2630326 RepID=UPI00141FA6D7|nr:MULTISPECIES: DUF2975 domain-containing protein [unclassified Pantoea]NIE77014.1 DUF2975 domain-containing protein [Pantoea sp. Ap-967]NIF26335.1 DUF2975 domain-containing protein [Pantoea sp. Tr-811]
MTYDPRPSSLPRPLIVFCAVALAWVAAAIELASPGLLWALEYDAMLDAILTDNAVNLGVPDAATFTPSSLLAGTLIALDCLVALAYAAPLFFSGLWFRNLHPTKAWTDTNIRWLGRIGLLCLCMPLIKSLAGMVQSLALSSELPPGLVGVSLGLDFSSAALSQIAMGLLLLAFAAMMRHAKSLHDENRCYV